MIDCLLFEMRVAMSNQLGVATWISQRDLFWPIVWLIWWQSTLECCMEVHQSYSGKGCGVLQSANQDCTTPILEANPCSTPGIRSHSGFPLSQIGIPLILSPDEEVIGQQELDLWKICSLIHDSHSFWPLSENPCLVSGDIQAIIASLSLDSLCSLLLSLANLITCTFNID